MKKKLLLVSLITFLFIFIQPVSSFAAGAFKISVSKSTMEYGTTQKVKVANAGKNKVTYKSSNTKVATVDKKGTIKAQYPGTAKITATAGKSRSTVSVKVIQKVTDLKIALKGNIAYINYSNPTNAVVQYEPIRAAKPVISYSIADTSIAKVDQNGKITALKEGKTTLTLKAGLKKKNFPITVKYGEIFWTKSIGMPYSYVPDASWSSNDKMLSVDNEVWDARNGKLIKIYDDRFIRFYTDGLGAIGNNGKLELYDNRLQQEKYFTYNPDSYASLEGKGKTIYTSDGRVIFFDDRQGLIMVNLASEAIENHYDYDKAYYYSTKDKIELSPDEQTLMVSYEKNLFFFDVNTGKLKEKLTFDGEVSRFAMSHDGSQLTVLYGNYGSAPTMDVIDFNKMLVDYSLDLESSDRKPVDLVYSPNGKYLATSGKDGVINIYRTSDYAHYKTLITPYNKRMIQQNAGNAIDVSNLAFSHDGGKLLAFYDSGSWYREPNVVLWNIGDLK
ncbi:Ig-like domain-containing protein [Aciduricibacillus chroicocephali]|uniref:Ig-like domain-containing protein n=1 Tax=Aciduricibacillus chroicocephali TaxID=3054939 RepID=A0ABY9KU41_9BACI|nr:Ig-like domain-containing protein [Bacillaceae bacterium 44XB]